MTEKQKIVILIDYPSKNGWCHLVANSIKDLHSFAKSIGVNKRYFHNNPKNNKPHYDIRGKKIQKAIEFGAKQVNSKDIVTFLKKIYK
ncbi:MAG: DUF4031 domain-containing protein [Candidatus Izemoplasmatales bacterium]